MANGLCPVSYTHLQNVQHTYSLLLAKSIRKITYNTSIACRSFAVNSVFFVENIQTANRVYHKTAPDFSGAALWFGIYDEGLENGLFVLCVQCFAQFLGGHGFLNRRLAAQAADTAVQVAGGLCIVCLLYTSRCV